MANDVRPRAPRETFQALYGLGRAFQPLPPEQRTDAQLEVLRELVIDLVMEVEALREALIREARRAGISPHATSYGQAYRDAALLTHDSRGFWLGEEKLLGVWHGWPDDRQRHHTPAGWRMREGVLMRRLGYSEQEIEQYAEEVDSVHQLT